MFVNDTEKGKLPLTPHSGEVQQWTWKNYYEQNNISILI